MPRLALVSAHTSPLELPSTGDAGGMNVYLASVLPELAALGWTVDVFTRASGDAVTEQWMVDDAVRVLGVPIEAGRPLDKYELARHADVVADAIVARHRGAPYDLVHSHYWVSGVAGEQAAGRMGIPHIHSMHSAGATKNARLSPDDEPEPPARLDAERRILQAASAVVVSCASEREDVASAYAVGEDRLAVVPPGVDARFHPAREVDPSGDDPRPVLALVGRVQPLKGQLLAVRALAALRDADPTSPRARLLLIGAANPGRDDYLEHVRSAVHDLGLTDDVELTGALDRDAVADRLRSATIALMPSAAETFGLVAIEAAASGVPVVARATSGLVDAVLDGVTGILIDSADPAVWASAIRTLLDDPGRRASFARAGLERTASMRWSDTAAGLDALYRRVVADA